MNPWGYPGLVFKFQTKPGENYLATCTGYTFVLELPTPCRSAARTTSTICSVIAQEGPKTLMPKLFPPNIPDLTTQHVLRINADITPALQCLPAAGMVHADIQLIQTPGRI